MGPAGGVSAQRLCAVPSVGETDGTAQFFLMSHTSTVSRAALFFEIVPICDINWSVISPVVTKRKTSATPDRRRMRFVSQLRFAGAGEVRVLTCLDNPR